MDEIKEDLYRDIVINKLEDELSNVGELLANIINNLAFIFNDDRQMFLNLIIQSYISTYDSDTNSFRLDVDAFSDGTPDESKVKLFNQVISQFSKNVDVYSLNKDTPSQDVNTDKKLPPTNHVYSSKYTKNELSKDENSDTKPDDVLPY